MNKKHWRDVKDFFKAGFLQTLRRGNGVVVGLNVFPMFTGTRPPQSEIAAYAEFLGFDLANVLNIEPFVPKVGRESFIYFRSAAEHPACDIFLDPDTGIADPRQAASRDHLTVVEVAHLLPPGSSRLLFIYQDSPDRSSKGEPLETGMLRKLDQLRMAGLAFFVYFGGVTNIVCVSGPSGIHRLVRAAIYLAHEIKVPFEKLLGIKAAGMPPRRITHEHEAAHAVVVHKGGGVVSLIEPSIVPLADGHISLGRAVWGAAGNQNTMLAGYAAGPAQTQISVAREGLDQRIADEALLQEGVDLAALLEEKTGRLSLPDAAVTILKPAVAKLLAYLSDPKVQKAVTAIADATEAAEGRGESSLDWSKLKDLVQWDEIPPLPNI